MQTYRRYDSLTLNTYNSKTIIASTFWYNELRNILLLQYIPDTMHIRYDCMERIVLLKVSKNLARYKLENNNLNHQNNYVDSNWLLEC